MRSKWKGVLVDFNLLNIYLNNFKIGIYKNNKYKLSFLLKKNKKIFYFLNNTLIFYNGNKFILKNIKKWDIGHCIGEYCETRKPFYFFSKKKNKRLLRR